MQPTADPCSPTRAPRRRLRIRWGWLATGAAVASAAGGVAVLGVWPPLATVMSASMAPTIKTGDVVVLQRLHRAPRIGDIAVVAVPDQARTRYGYPPVVIHRIVRISAAGVVTTKGDARPQVDPFTVPRAQLTTKVVGTIPAAGQIIAFMTSGLGLIWLLAGGALLVGMPLLDRHRDAQVRDEQAAATVGDQLNAILEELAHLRAQRDVVPPAPAVATLAAPAPAVPPARIEDPPAAEGPAAEDPPQIADAPALPERLFLEIGELAALLGAADTQDGSPETYLGRRAIVAILGGSCVAVDELCDLRLADVRLHADGGGRLRLRLRGAPGGAAVREITISPRVAEEIAAHLDRLRRTAPGDRLFANGRRRTLRAGRVDDIVRHAGELASSRLAEDGLPALPDVTPGTLRATHLAAMLLAHELDEARVLRTPGAGARDAELTAAVAVQLRLRLEHQGATRLHAA